jgi:hypothetical protein
MRIIIPKIFRQGDSCWVSYQVADTDELSEDLGLSDDEFREWLEMMIQSPEPMPTFKVKSVTLEGDSGQVEIEVPQRSVESRISRRPPG